MQKAAKRGLGSTQFVKPSPASPLSFSKHNGGTEST
jgi:hypothetical protein